MFYSLMIDVFGMNQRMFSIYFFILVKKYLISIICSCDLWLSVCVDILSPQSLGLKYSHTKCASKVIRRTIFQFHPSEYHFQHLTSITMPYVNMRSARNTLSNWLKIIETTKSRERIIKYDVRHTKFSHFQ